jgi:hypothetical protein
MLSAFHYIFVQMVAVDLLCKIDAPRPIVFCNELTTTERYTLIEEERAAIAKTLQV